MKKSKKEKRVITRTDEQNKQKFIKLLKKAEEQTGMTLASYLKFDVNGIMPRLAVVKLNAPVLDKPLSQDIKL